jgi:bleomycin hydrolase
VGEKGQIWACAIFLFALPVFGVEPGKVDPCAEFAALTPEQMLAIRPEFLAQHDSNYSLRLPERPIRNQCKYGGCWAYQTLSFIESRLPRKSSAHTDLSEAYLILRDLQMKAKDALSEPGKTIGQASNLPKGLELVHHFGIVPQSAWQPRVSFEEASHGNRLVGYLNDRVAQFHLEAEGKSQAERRNLSEAAQRDLDHIIEAYSGPMPTAFTVDGRTFESPLEYWKQMQIPIKKMLRIFPIRPALPKAWGPEPAPAVTAQGKIPDGPYRHRLPVSAPEETYRNFNEIEYQILESLRRGESVPISMELARRYVDKKTGIMSLAAFPAPAGLKPAPRPYRLRYDLNGGGHAMEIVGADLNERGDVVKYRLRNTWGEESGDAGYYHVYADYFREYLIGAYLPEKVQ